MKLPGEIQDFLRKNSEVELALIGCRADSPHKSYDCCEYDIAIIGENTKNSFDKKIIQLGDNTLEFLDFPNQNGRNDIALSNMVKLKDSNTLISESPKFDRKKMFMAAGKR